MDDWGFRDLCHAILRQACEDLVNHVGSRQELVAFFGGEWCGWLLSVTRLRMDGPGLWQALTRNASVRRRVRHPSAERLHLCIVEQRWSRRSRGWWCEGKAHCPEIAYCWQD